MPPEQETKDKEEPKTDDAIAKVLDDLKAAADKINKPEEKPEAPAAPTYADRRAVLQKSLGYTDEQMAAHEEMILRAQAPVIERTAWSILEKRPDLDTYRSEIEKELSIYPQERRTPEIMEKIYYYVKGKHSDAKPKETPKSPKVESTRVSGGPGYTGSEPSLSGSREENPNAPNEELNDNEKFVADKLGVDYKSYAKSRNAGRAIRELRVPDERPVTSLADVELRRLISKR